jgi:hypothetical protein
MTPKRGERFFYVPWKDATVLTATGNFQLKKALGIRPWPNWMDDLRLPAYYGGNSFDHQKTEKIVEGTFLSGIETFDENTTVSWEWEIGDLREIIPVERVVEAALCN